MKVTYPSLIALFGILVLFSANPGLVPNVGAASNTGVHIITTIPDNIGKYYYDSSSGYVYGIGSSFGVFLINAATNVVSSELLPTAAISNSFFDSANNEVYVTYCPVTGCNKYYDVAVIKGSQVIATLKAIGNQTQPYFIAYNAANKDIYLFSSKEDPYGYEHLCPCYLYANVLDTVGNSIVKTLVFWKGSDSGGDMGQYISGVAYDAADSNLYVASCFWTDEPSQSGFSYTISNSNSVKSIADYGCETFDQDPANGNMYLEGQLCGFYYGCGGVAILSGSANKVLKSYPQCSGANALNYWPCQGLAEGEIGLTISAYDPASREMFVNCQFITCNRTA